MINLRNELKKFVKKGDLYLSAGGGSDVYIDLREACGKSLIRNAMVDRLYHIMDRGVNCVAGIGMGGIMLATTMATRYNLNLVTVRDKPKSHGTQSRIEGHPLEKGDLVAPIDDVLTTGNSLGTLIGILIKTPARLSPASVVVKRGEVCLPFPLRHLYTLEEIIKD